MTRKDAAQNRKADSLLLERYRKEYLHQPDFRCGLGVTWPSLRRSILEEAIRCQSVGSGIPPFTLAQAAAVLNVPPRQLLILEKAYPGSDRLFPLAAGFTGGVRKALVSPARLLEWAATVPEVCSWRTARAEEASLGATAKPQDILDQLEMLQAAPAAMLMGRRRGEVPKVLSLRPDPVSFPIDVQDIFRWQDEDERSAHGAYDTEVHEVALPDALGLPWADEGLRRVWMERFRRALARLGLLLETRRSEASNAVRRAQADLSLADEGRRTIRLAIANAR